MSDLKKRTHSRKKRNIEVESNTTQFQTLEHPMLLQFGIALVLSIVAFIGYRITIAPIALPGEPSEYLPVISEVFPRFTYKNYIWQNFLNVLFNMGGSLAFINNVCSIISALAVGMLYLVTSSMMGLFLNGNSIGGILKADNPTGQINVEATTKRLQYYASVLSGVTAAMCLAFCPPYWMAATMAYYHSFYLLWLLISAFLVLRFSMTTKLPYLYAFCFIHALGMTQTSCFVAFAPLLYLLAAYILLASDKLNLKTTLISIILTVVGFSFVFYVASSYCSSEIAEISNKTKFVPVVKELVGGLVRGVFSDLPKVGWMIILGTTIAPFAASLISGRRSINGEGDWSFYALNLAIFVTTLIVVFDARISPWNMFGFSTPYIIPYTLVAMTLGYSITYIYLLSIYLFKYIPTWVNFGAFVRYFAMALAVIICLITTINNYSKADNRRMSFVNTFIDKLIEGMGERKWLVTEGFFDNAIAIRAKELDKEIHLIDWSYVYNNIVRQLLKKDIKKAFPNNIRLSNTVDIGVMPLLQEWIQNQPEANKDVALMLFPDVWNFGDFDSYPCGLTFCGMEPQALLKYNLDDIVAQYVETLGMMEQELPEFKEITRKEMKRIDYMSNFVRRKVSFIGNNLAYVLEQQGKIDEAFNLYYRVHKFDPDNISALLNVSALIQKYEKYSKYQEEATLALSEFQRRNATSPAIWSISRVYGYVSRPEVFTQLGWTWALSGQNNMALKSLARVLNHADVENTNLLKNMMARIHANQNDVVASEELYLEVLKVDPADQAALQGLIFLYMNNGDFQKAKQWLGPAERAGVPRTTILYLTATMLTFSDALDEARIVLNELIDIDPKNYQAILLQIQIYHSMFENAKEDEVKRSEALQGIEKELEKLKDIEGADSFVTSMAEGGYKQLISDFAGARACFLVALKQTRSEKYIHRNINQTPIYEEILRMDISLNDKEAARHHARQILHLDANNWLANYALGSLALNVGDLAEAEDYLQHSVDSNESLVAINDLAYAKYLLRKMNEAEKLIQRGLEIDRNLYVLWDTYGCIKLSQRRFDEAEIHLKRAIQLYDDDLRPHLHLAQVYFNTQRYDECREVMRRLSASADTFVGRDREEYDALAQAIISLK
ncbi:MAG: tetratricopeptide repeat protein [Kiritimatiellae bacterium]|nr:tetratricopeptide repeat protein [Kiritimatiellia bacterium]